MNWRWKRIIICTVIGLVAGIFMSTQQSTMAGSGSGLTVVIILVMPLAINFLYWGWVAVGNFLGKWNIFLMMSIGKWIVYLMIRMTLSCLVGYVMFPIAIYKAIKNVD